MYLAAADIFFRVSYIFKPTVYNTSQYTQNLHNAPSHSLTPINAS